MNKRIFFTTSAAVAGGSHSVELFHRDTFARRHGVTCTVWREQPLLEKLGTFFWKSRNCNLEYRGHPRALMALRVHCLIGMVSWTGQSSWSNLGSEA